jgi:hypothetical protein
MSTSNSTKQQSNEQIQHHVDWNELLIDRSNWLLLCCQLFERGPIFAGKYLNEQFIEHIKDHNPICTSLFYIFLKYFFDHAKQLKFGNQLVSEWCLQLLCAGQPPEKFLKKLKVNIRIKRTI